MIKPPSLQSTYTFVWSQDPALELPEVPLVGTDAQRAAVELERGRILRVARQTGNYPLAEGQQPTVFHLRNLERSDISWINGEQGNSTEHGRPLSGLEADDLTVRLALTSIDNFGAHKLERKRLGSQRHVTTSETINALYAAVGEHGNDLIFEIARHIVQRANGVIDPL